MAQYGRPLDTGYDPNRDLIYRNFAEYFEHPVLTKIRDVQQYSVYMAKIYALLGIEQHYVVVLIPKNLEEDGHQERLANLQWESLQTRALEEDHDIPVHSYTPRRLPSINKTIRLTHQDPNQYVYSVDNMPLKVTLLPRKKDQTMEYSRSGSVVTALETFSTILSWNP